MQLVQFVQFINFLIIALTEQTANIKKMNAFYNGTNCILNCINCIRFFKKEALTWLVLLQGAKRGLVQFLYLVC